MPRAEGIKYGEDNPIEAAPVLSAEEEHTLKQRMATMDKLLSEKGLAKYKLEIQFERKRSNRNATFGIMSFWESGTKLHGGGDTRIYICPGKHLKRNDCEGFIPDASAGYGHLFCPKCKITWTGEQVLGEVGARLTMQNWAVLIHKYFMRLEGNCDVALKYPKHDIRVLAQMEQVKQLKGDELAKLRRDQQRCIYPLRNIIKDVSSGSDLLTKFYAFLKA